MPKILEPKTTNWENERYGKIMKNSGTAAVNVRTARRAMLEDRAQLDRLETVEASHHNQSDEHRLQDFQTNEVLSRIGEEARKIEAEGGKHQTIQHNEAGFGSGYAV